VVHRHSYYRSHKRHCCSGRIYINTLRGKNAKDKKRPENNEGDEETVQRQKGQAGLLRLQEEGLNQGGMQEEMTKWFILGTGIIWLVYDIYLDRSGKKTLSNIILGTIGKYGVPIIFITGFVMGHLFWPQ